MEKRENRECRRQTERRGELKWRRERREWRDKKEKRENGGERL